MHAQKHRGRRRGGSHGPDVLAMIIVADVELARSKAPLKAFGQLVDKRRDYDPQRGPQIPQRDSCDHEFVAVFFLAARTWTA
jgi:hypothetical protein